MKAISPRSATSVAVALVFGTALLAGCSGNDTASVPSGGSTVPATTDTQTAAPVQPDEPTAPAAGAVLDSEADANAAEDAGLKVYTAADGSKVAVDPHAPMPEVMVTDIRATAGSQAVTDGSATANSSARSAAYRQAAAVGKQVVFILPGGQYDESGNVTDTWVSIGTTDQSLGVMGVHYGSQGEAVAAAQAAIAASADPSIYEVIDLIG